MNKTTIKAEIVAHSRNQQGDELVSLSITFPRIILAEVNTHRMLSKNTSSSRAIPFKKMVEAVQNDPFIPIAWQKNHSGMQGTEYLSKTDKYNLISFVDALDSTLQNMVPKTKEYDKVRKEIEEKIDIINNLLSSYTHLTKTLDDWWLFARDKAVEAASIMYVFGVTKQLCNRLLEPFMWTTMLITGSKEGWDNFFRLRCPQYHYDLEDKYFHSKKEWLNYYRTNCIEDLNSNFELDEMDWFNINKGQAEIHIMDLAEKIYDAMNESTPKQLKAGEWHIPYEDKILSNLIIFKATHIPNMESVEYTYDPFYDGPNTIVKISTAMAARESYTVVGNEKIVDYQKQIDLHDRLIVQDPPHSSCLEHCNRAMTDWEYESFIKGNVDIGFDIPKEAQGWCNNIKGFIPYRYMIDNNLTM